jgi:hypothetical protein
MDKLFARFANATVKATGSSVLLCELLIVVWGASGNRDRLLRLNRGSSQPAGAR